VRLVPLLQQVLEENAGKVKVVFKQFPLAMHKMARKSAAASLAAKEQGKYWEYHDKLLENSKLLSDSKLQEIAKDLALDMEKFNKDIADASIHQAITSDTRNGQRAGVRGTPTVFINGKRMKSRSRQSFQQMIDAELKKTSEKAEAD
jgi:protein-disulfide isomerase